MDALEFAEKMLTAIGVEFSSPYEDEDLDADIILKKRASRNGTIYPKGYYIHPRGYRA